MKFGFIRAAGILAALAGLLAPQPVLHGQFSDARRLA